MKQVKKTSQVKQIKAADGHVLPVFYKGSIIHIDDKATVEIDFGLLKYEPKIQLEQALKDKIIFELGAGK